MGSLLFGGLSTSEWNRILNAHELKQEPNGYLEVLEGSLQMWSMQTSGTGASEVSAKLESPGDAASDSGVRAKALGERLCCGDGVCSRNMLDAATEGDCERLQHGVGQFDRETNRPKLSQILWSSRMIINAFERHHPIPQKTLGLSDANRTRVPKTFSKETFNNVVCSWSLDKKPFPPQTHPGLSPE